MEDFQYPYQTKTITLNGGIQIAYVDEGQGEHIQLMIHGLGSYLPAWQKNIALLKDHFRCIALDLPNYGKSTKGSFPFTVDFFADIILAFIQRLDLDNVSLIGHLMGAQIAISACLKSAVNFNKLVLIAPAGFETFTESEKQFFYENITAESIRSMSIEQIRQSFALNFHNKIGFVAFYIKALNGNKLHKNAEN
jgi:pimeloyl-ACP methyl ester carboxylesterase